MARTASAMLTIRLIGVVSGIHIACAVGACRCRAQCQGDEADDASDKTDSRHEYADTPKLKSVPEWFEQKMLKNDTKFQVQSERANFL